MAVGCGERTPVTSGRSLCQGKSGLAASITGITPTVSLCIPNDSIVGDTEFGVETTYSKQNNWYLISASSAFDSVTYEFRIGFHGQSVAPVALRITGDEAEALFFPEAAWFSYSEIRGSNLIYLSNSASGECKVTFNDSKIAVGTFSNILVELSDPEDNPVGQRTLQKGFFNVSVDR